MIDVFSVTYVNKTTENVYSTFSLSLSVSEKRIYNMDNYTAIFILFIIF